MVERDMILMAFVLTLIADRTRLQTTCPAEGTTAADDSSPRGKLSAENSGRGRQAIENMLES